MSESSSLHQKSECGLPSYACCRQGELFIVNNRNGDLTGIYRYTAEGDYLGCVTTEVNIPAGIALSKGWHAIVCCRM